MKRIMIDASLCTGCLNCSIACMNAHRDSQKTGTFNAADPNNPPRNRVEQRKKKYYPIFCRCCSDPDCVNTCMSKALAKDSETGLVTYDEKACAKCFMCVMACRYGHPRPSASLDRVVRCDFCRDTEEKEPQCVKACPVKAIYIQEEGV